MSSAVLPPDGTDHPELLIGTHNRGKVAEIEALLAGWSCRALPQEADEYPEDAAAFAANARGKALHYARLTGLLTLADDSGLEIDALGGEPGVYSARYIDPAMSQERRNLAVLECLAGVADADRGARSLTINFRSRTS